MLQQQNTMEFLKANFRIKGFFIIFDHFFNILRQILIPFPGLTTHKKK